MLGKGSDWYKLDGASSDEIERLKSVSKITLPNKIFELLAYSNGGEGSLPVQPYNFCLDSAKTITQTLIDKTFEEFFPDFIVFGSSGGGDLIAIDTRLENAMPIVSLDATNIDIEESRILIAESFTKFIDLIGFEETDD